MTHQLFVAFDPGYATGMASGRIVDDGPLELLDAAIVPYEFWQPAWYELLGAADQITPIAEKFTLRDNEFRADLTAVRIEGTLELLWDHINWRDPSTKTQVPDEVLRDIEWWQTGSDVDWEDGRDANDAIIHLLGHVAFTMRHEPTLRAYFR